MVRSFRHLSRDDDDDDDDKDCLRFGQRPALVAAVAAIWSHRQDTIDPIAILIIINIIYDFVCQPLCSRMVPARKGERERTSTHRMYSIFVYTCLRYIIFTSCAAAGRRTFLAMCLHARDAAAVKRCVFITDKTPLKRAIYWTADDKLRRHNVLDGAAPRRRCRRCRCCCLEMTMEMEMKCTRRGIGGRGMRALVLPKMLEHRDRASSLCTIIITI